MTSKINMMGRVFQKKGHSAWQPYSVQGGIGSRHVISKDNSLLSCVLNREDNQISKNVQEFQRRASLYRI